MCVLLLFAIKFKNVKERQLHIAVAIVGRAKSIERTIEKRSHKQNNILSKGLRATILAIAKLEEG